MTLSLNLKQPADIVPPPNGMLLEYWHPDRLLELFADFGLLYRYIPTDYLYVIVRIDEAGSVSEIWGVSTTGDTAHEEVASCLFPKDREYEVIP
jgi:hypothetical protein